jgi:hypothetical protein
LGVVPFSVVPVFMFCAHGHVFGGTRFHVLRARTRFRWYRFHVLRARTRFRWFRFHVLRIRTHFRWYRWASGPVFMFGAPELIFGDTEGVGFVFHISRSRTHCPRYRGRRVLFSSFARSDSFSTESRASCRVFMFCAPGLIYSDTQAVGSGFHVSRSWTHFRWYRGRRLPFSCFTRLDTFSAVPRASAPVFMFCSPGHVFGCTDGVGTHFHVLRTRTRFSWY